MLREISIQQSEIEIRLKLDDILKSSCGQTDTLFSQNFTKRSDNFLETLDDKEEEKAISILNEDKYPYFHDAHDYSTEPFDENGWCKHGLTWETCPCGCGDY